MLIALSAKNKVDFVDGSIIEEEPDSSKFQSWSRYNDMVISWTLNALSNEIAESIFYLERFRHVWKIDLDDEMEPSFTTYRKNLVN